jgi:hypothetical protein
VKRVGDISMDERALRKASSFCLSIMLSRYAVLVVKTCCNHSMCTSRHQYKPAIAIQMESNQSGWTCFRKF